MRPVLGLLRACHPGPSVAVTAFALLWGGVGVGLPVGTLLLLGAAVLSGQLSIGWANDHLDAGIDVAAGRGGKPVVAGLVSGRVVGLAAVVALGVCVVTSLSLGIAAGVVHLLAVASAWAYDLRLKTTPWSPLPYAVSFGLLPAVATLAADPPAVPSAAVVGAAALLGVAAHFANTVPDAEADASTGVRGLPQRLGPAGSLRVAAAGIGLAAAVLLLGGGGRPLGQGLLLAGVLLPLLAVATGRRRGTVGRSAFWLVVAGAGFVVLGFVLG